MSYRSTAKRKIPNISKNEFERTRAWDPKMLNANDLEPNATDTSLSNVTRTAIITADFSGLAFGDDRGGTLPALLKIKNTCMLERLLSQLKSSGFTQIYIITGYEKERLAYLADVPGLTLSYNPAYRDGNSRAVRSIIKELEHAGKRFSVLLLNAGLYLSEAVSKNLNIVLAQAEIVFTATPAAASIPLIFFSEKAGADGSLLKALHLVDNDDIFAALLAERTLKHQARVLVFSEQDAFNVETSNDYLNLLSQFDSTQKDALAWAATALKAEPSDLLWEEPVKRGMTNRTLAFSFKNERYLLRVPGAGTSELLNRHQEADVYRAIAAWPHAEKVLAFDPLTGRKISKFITGSHTCRPYNLADLKLSLHTLRDLHQAALTVPHRFDLAERINFYTELCQGEPSPFQDHAAVRQSIDRILVWLNSLPRHETLCHIDFNPDNTLIAGKKCTLIDWEYAAMQDPLCDLAMFAIYAGYNRDALDRFIDLYFALDGITPEPFERLKVYAYVAVAGFLWDIWCQYKSQQGVEFGEYWQNQFLYAKHYSTLVLQTLPQLELTRTENAVILAAGMSSRFVPHSLLKPKGLWEVNGEVLIERQIRQLREAGVKDITVVTGYKAEQFAYLKEKFAIKIVFNPFFATKNNIYSLLPVAEKLGNTYICSADNYFTANPFRLYDQKPYYAVNRARGETAEWCVYTDADGLINKVKIGGRNAFYMIGQVRLDRGAAAALCEVLRTAAKDPASDNLLWEAVYAANTAKIPLYPKLYRQGLIYEFDTVGEVSKFDPDFLVKQPSEILAAVEASYGIAPAEWNKFVSVDLQSLPESLRHRITAVSTAAAASTTDVVSPTAVASTTAAASVLRLWRKRRCFLLLLDKNNQLLSLLDAAGRPLPTKQPRPTKFEQKSSPRINLQEDL
ncbi:phosphotransferase enzyme family [Mageeibacillus indolicus UPII9-5]|uniref:Phosphotransferase enzyme family n=1 Tax=Mageeibacillus indolicus (strain UPII9-5) TaxID=699246 RepID=D3QZD7_MAGIU|nr:NTP transferase domain-containing protein [Mageeibacillus indolicus]ADC91203.1 phosphotransferase enzyme family [Mageeibacillus indolicus UPII9-5]